MTITYIASNPEEAVQCARVQYGESVIDSDIEDYAFSVTCPHTGCHDRTYPGRDQGSAESCAKATSIGCTVDDSPCP